MPFGPIPHRRTRSASLAVSLRWLGARHALALLFLVACALIAVGQHKEEELAVDPHPRGAGHGAAAGRACAHRARRWTMPGEPPPVTGSPCMTKTNG